jgi:hypothetical protein
MRHFHSTDSLMVYYTVQDRTSVETVWRNVLPLPSGWLNLIHEHGAITQNDVVRQKTCSSTRIITYVIHEAVPVFRLVSIILNVQWLKLYKRHDEFIK